MCPICFWEDDGQDSANAHIVSGGPNGDCSLQEARQNYNETGCFQRIPVEKNQSRRAELTLAYKNALTTLKDDDWEEVLRLEMVIRENMV